MKVLADNQATLKKEAEDAKRVITKTKQTALKLQTELINRDNKISELEKKLAELKK